MRPIVTRRLRTKRDHSIGKSHPKLVSAHPDALQRDVQVLRTQTNATARALVVELAPGRPPGPLHHECGWAVRPVRDIASHTSSPDTTFCNFTRLSYARFSSGGNHTTLTMWVSWCIIQELKWSVCIMGRCLFKMGKFWRRRWVKYSRFT